MATPLRNPQDGINHHLHNKWTPSNSSLHLFKFKLPSHSLWAKFKKAPNGWDEVPIYTSQKVPQAWSRCLLSSTCNKLARTSLPASAIALRLLLIYEMGLYSTIVLKMADFWHGAWLREQEEGGEIYCRLREAMHNLIWKSSVTLWRLSVTSRCSKEFPVRWLTVQIGSGVELICHIRRRWIKETFPRAGHHFVKLLWVYYLYPSNLGDIQYYTLYSGNPRTSPQMFNQYFCNQSFSERCVYLAVCCSYHFISFHPLNNMDLPNFNQGTVKNLPTASYHCILKA